MPYLSKLMRWIFVSLLAVLLLGCVSQGHDAASQSSKGGQSILILGDSLLATNRLTSASVGDALAEKTGASVHDRSTLGARYFYALPISGAAGMRITAQFEKGDWDVIVVNGGGNDILFGCGCAKCDHMLDRLIAADGGSGAIPEFLARIGQTGAQVIYVGYLRTPGVTAPVEGCGPIGDEMDRRLTLMDQAMKGVRFLAMSDLVPFGDRSFHRMDLVHPSAKGSSAIAARISAAID